MMAGVASAVRSDRGRATALLLAGLIVAVGAAPAPASAGDNPAMFYFEPGEVEADAGETVAVDVLVRTSGGYEGDGVTRSAVSVAYDPDVLTAVEVERGPFLEGDDGATVEATTEHNGSVGVATIEQERDAGDGVIGTGPIATVTFEVAADARPTNASLTMTDVEAVLANDHNQQTMTREGTVLVEGGVESDGESGAGDGVILADDAGADAAGDADGDDSTDEAIPGFGPLASLVAIGAVLLGGHRRASRRR